MRVVLNHFSRVKGAVGGPGDTVNVGDAQAKVWIESGAAVIAPKDEKPAKAKASKPAKGKPVDDKPNEPAAEIAASGDGESENDAGDETETTGSGSSEPDESASKVKPAKKKAVQK